MDLDIVVFRTRAVLSYVQVQGDHISSGTTDLGTAAIDLRPVPPERSLKSNIPADVDPDVDVKVKIVTYILVTAG